MTKIKFFKKAKSGISKPEKKKVVDVVAFMTARKPGEMCIIRKGGFQCS